MKLIGYKESNFRPDKTKDEEIKGYMIYIEMEIDPHRGKGFEVDRQYLSQNKINN